MKKSQVIVNTTAPYPLLAVKFTAGCQSTKQAQIRKTLTKMSPREHKAPCTIRKVQSLLAFSGERMMFLVLSRNSSERNRVSKGPQNWVHRELNVQHVKLMIKFNTL